MDHQFLISKAMPYFPKPFTIKLNSLVAVALGCVLAGSSLSAADWQAQGPAPITGAGNVDGMVNPTNPQDGAVQAIAPHPTDANTIYIGTANGGVWKTVDGGNTWTPLTDVYASLSIGGVALDPLDTSYKTVVVTIGRWSNSAEEGGPRSGMLYSKDAGATWSRLGGTTLTNFNLGAVAARGAVLMSVANKSDAGPGGFFRSIDTGQTFASAPAGLPANGTFTTLTGDPSDPKVFYTVDILSGVYRSADTGATWNNVTGTITNFTGQPVNATVAVGANGGVVFISIVKTGGKNVDMYYSTDSGATWKTMDPPGSNERLPESPNKDVFFSPNPSGQGNNSSLAADPQNPNLIYIAGDTQPFVGVSSGARAYSGRMFRGDASLAAGAQWGYLTGNFTANSSAPHADSRVMVFDAAGNLLEGDDGGIYKRTSPQSTNGGWFSIMGNLQATETHSVAYDRLTKTLLSGNQDNGVSAQSAPGALSWTEVSGGDGGKVAINNSNPTFSVRYYSSQNLGGFTHDKIDKSNNSVDQSSPALLVGNANLATYAEGKGEEWADDETGDAISFFPIVTLNRIDQTRIAISTKRVYIGIDNVSGALSQTLTLTDISTTSFDSETAAVDWGHKDNPNLMLIGAGNAVYLSTTSAPDSIQKLGNYNGDTITSVILHPGSAQTLFVSDRKTVWRSTDAGTSWTNIGEALQNLGFQQLRTLQFMSKNGTNVLMVGGLGGFYASLVDATPNVWFKFGNGMPNVLVWDAKYDAVDDILVAGTLGRGSWTLPSASAAVFGAGAPPVLGANTAPVITVPLQQTVVVGSSLTFTVSAVDTDVPAQKLTFKLSADAPAGAAIDTSTGVFTWTPGANAVNTTNVFTIQVTDDGVPNLSDSKSVTVIVTDGLTKNTPPVLDDLPNKSVQAGQLLSFAANVTDTDVPKQVLTFSLSPGAPDGAVINPGNGLFTWTPTAAQANATYTITIKVTDSGSPPLSDTKSFAVAVSGEVVVPKNTPPMLAEIPNVIGHVGQLLTFTSHATDSDVPAQTLTFSLEAGAPGGALIDAATGVFTWTPTASQANSTNVITVVVTDSGSPKLSDRKEFVVVVSDSVVVLPKNTPPVLTLLTNRSIQANELTSFTIHATDADLPAQTLTFSVDAGAPSGIIVDPATGGFSWTPTLGQVGTTNLITVRVTDNGTPPLSDSQTFIVTVAPPDAVVPVNKPPILGALTAQSGRVGNKLTFTAVATDPDSPPQILTYSLEPGAPVGASIDPATGAFSWTPSDTQTGSFAITIKVTDNGTPNLSDTQSVDVTILPATISGDQIKLRAGAMLGGGFTIGVTATAGKPYVLEYSNDLIQWTTLVTTNAPSASFELTDTNAGASKLRFYRVRSGN